MKFITQDEVAERLRVSVKTVERLRKQGKLRYLPGRPVKIPEDDLDAYVRRALVTDRPDPPATIPPDIAGKVIWMKVQAGRLMAQGKGDEALKLKAEAMALAAPWPRRRRPKA